MVFNILITNYTWGLIASAGRPWARATAGEHASTAKMHQKVVVTFKFKLPTLTYQIKDMCLLSFLKKYWFYTDFDLTIGFKSIISPEIKDFRSNFEL